MPPKKQETKEKEAKEKDAKEPSQAKLSPAKAAARPTVVLPDVDAENTVINSTMLAAQLEQAVEYAFGPDLLTVLGVGRGGCAQCDVFVGACTLFLSYM